MKILVISSCPTHPTVSGNRKCILDYCKMFESRGYDVFFLLVNYDFYNRSQEYIIETKEKWGDHFFLFQTNLFHSLYKHFVNKWRKCVNNYYWKVDDWYPIGLTRYVNKLHSLYHFDSVIVNYVYLSRVFCGLQINNQNLYTHDCFVHKSVRVGVEADFALSPSEESKGLRRCKTILSIQENESILFNYLAPGKKILTTYSFFDINILPITGFNRLLFFSGPNLYNINGIMGFIKDIMPAIHNTFPDFELFIGGKICDVLDKHNLPSYIQLKGKFNKAEDFYILGDIVINPVFQGTGLKIKTFESLSFGRITIVDKHSCEGVFDQVNSPVLIANDSQTYINYINQLITKKQREITQNSIVQYMERFQNYVISTFEEAVNNTSLQ